MSYLELNIIIIFDNVDAQDSQDYKLTFFSENKTHYETVKDVLI